MPSDGLRGYVICGEQRSGSSYLCQMLTSTGLLGRPIEYFSGPGMATYFPGYPQDPEGQLRQVTERGTTPNGVYGLKIFSADFDRIGRIGWARRLPNLRFVSLTRRDLLGQAISAARSAQTGQYASIVGASKVPVYDRALIISELHRLAAGQTRWAVFFARCGLMPLHLEYEEIVADPQKAVDAVARLVGVKQPTIVDPGQIRTRVQRDCLSEEWRARLLAEAADLDFLDNPFPSPSPSSLATRVKRKMARWVRRAS
ncbi:MAG TPA: Stf0 family sulfotransferase [Allosphingosinicella sp.]